MVPQESPLPQARDPWAGVLLCGLSAGLALALVGVKYALVANLVVLGNHVGWLVVPWVAGVALAAWLLQASWSQGATALGLVGLLLLPNLALTPWPYEMEGAVVNIVVPEGATEKGRTAGTTRYGDYAVQYGGLQYEYPSGTNATALFERLRTHLTAEGWHITDESATGDEPGVPTRLTLEARREGFSLEAEGYPPRDATGTLDFRLTVSALYFTSAARSLTMGGSPWPFPFSPEDLKEACEERGERGGLCVNASPGNSSTA